MAAARHGAESVEAAPAPAPASARSAVRCEECHEDYVRAWRGSGHAAARQSPVYAAMRAEAGAGCDRCHAPLVGAIAADDPIHAEGVTCDVCHAIAEVRAGAGGALAPAFDLVSTRRYGPLCDARDHYFHRMGCSPLHAESRLCGACHQLEWPTAAGTVPVFTEFAEWQAAVDPAAGPSCQRCHMEGGAGEVARGWPARPQVSSHAFLSDEERGGGLTLALRLAEGAGPGVEATVGNDGAAHALPAGLPGRRIVLVLRALDAEGAEVAREERAYARVLVDESGAEVPFYAAARVAEDSRLGAGERRIERWSVATAGVAAFEAELWLRPLPAEVAARLEIAPPRAHLLGRRRIAAPAGPGDTRRGRRGR